MTNATALLSSINLSTLEGHIEASRYLTAYRDTEALWSEPELVERLEPEQLVLAARLAGHLGGHKLSRWFMRHGRSVFPDHPAVSFYATYFGTQRENPVDAFRDFEIRELDGLTYDDPKLQAHWLATAAMSWGSVRQMTRAHRLLDDALALEVDTGYTLMAQAVVHFMEDQWERALDCAERAWTLAPGRPATANTLGRILSRAGRVEEAANRLYGAAKEHESFGIAVEAIRYCMSMAEHAEGDEQTHWSDWAQELNHDLGARAPLADRDTLRTLDFIRFDVAQFRQDLGALESLSNEGATPFLRTLSADLVKATDKRRLLLPYTPLRQKHNTCLPTAIGAILTARGDAIDVDALVKQISFGGTASWRATEWLKEQGYAAHPILLDRHVATTLLEAGHTFVFITSHLDNSHAMTAIGIDYAADCLLVHDPSGLRWLRYELAHLGDTEHPLGPEGILITTPEDWESARQLIDAENLDVAQAYTAYQQASERSGNTAANNVLAELENRSRRHPVTRFVKALQYRNHGRSQDAKRILQELMESHPRCERLQATIMSVYDSAGEFTRLCNALEEIVEGARLPGMEREQEWRRPPATFVMRYVHLLSRSDDKLPKARRIVRHAISWNPYSARHYFALGIVLHRAGETEAALLPARIAAYLELEDEQFARFLVFVFANVGKEEEGFQFLKERAEKLSASDLGAEAWTTLVDVLESSGYPERAQRVLRDALATHPKNAPLLAFSTQFFANGGHWNEAHEALQSLESEDHHLLFLQAATYFHARRGNRKSAREYGESWLREAPLAENARHSYLHQLTMESGTEAGVQCVQAWLKHQPDNEMLEYTLFELYRELFNDEAIEALLGNALRRNPDDAWAWRERTLRLLRKIDSTPPTERTLLMDDLAVGLEACTRICPDHPVTAIIKARHAGILGIARESLRCYMEAVERDISLLSHVGELLNALHGVPREERAAILNQFEERLLQTTGPLTGAGDLSVLFAEHLGRDSAREALKRWARHRSLDAHLINAHANLLLNYGEGTSHAEEALQLVREGTKRFPANSELKHTLARCLNALDHADEEESVLRVLIQQVPTDLHPRLRLARLLALQEKHDETRVLLKEAIAIDPSHPGARDAYAHCLWEQNHPLESIAALEEALRFMPESIGLRELLIERYMDMGDEANAVRTSREGIDRFPSGSYLWYLYGALLERSSLHRNPEEIEAAFRKSLALNASLTDSADALATFLCEMRRFDEARAILETQITLVQHSVSLRGRLAWIQHAEGKQDEARDLMYALLQEDPRYGWGWRMLIGWLENDGDLERVRTMLSGIHTAIPEDSFLRGLALNTVTRLEEDERAQEDTWKQLLHDFPKDHSIGLMRFDLLFESDRMQEARELLDTVSRFHPTSTFLLARDVQISCQEGNTDRAMQAARVIWTQPSGDSTWPEESSWDAVARAGQGDWAAQIIFDALAADYRVGTLIFACVCDYIHERHWDIWISPRLWSNRQRPFPSVWIQGKSAHRLLALLETMETVTWDATQHRAIVLNKLVRMGYGRCAYHWCMHHKNHMEQSPVIWEAAGFAILRCWPKHRHYHRFFADWQNKPGIDLRNAALYVWSLKAPRGSAEKRQHHLQRVCTHAQQGLQQLQHDETVRYMACQLGASLLQLERWEAFVACMERYGAYIEDDARAGDYFLPDDFQHVPAVLTGFYDLLRMEITDDAAIHRLADHLTHTFTRSKCPSWVSETWHRCVAYRNPAVSFDRRWSWRMKRFLTL